MRPARTRRKENQVPEPEFATGADGLASEPFDPDLDAVRIEYDEGGCAVGFWLVPDRAKVVTVGGEPAIRRSEMALLLGQGGEAARYVLGVLRTFPGATLRSIGGQGVGR